MERKSYDEESISKSSSEAESFLSQQDIEAPLWQQRGNLRQRIWSTCNVIFTVFNVAFLVFLVLAWHSGPLFDEPRLPSFDFTAPALKTEIRAFDDVFGKHAGKYRGDPRPELDEAWRGLMNGYNLRVPASVAITPATQNRSLVEMPDGSGDHYAVLGVLHELHCLRTMREYLFPDYYPQTYARFKPEPGEMIGVHIDHCFDVLRQSSMCHADMTLLPLEWWDGFNVPQNVIHAPHQCANWEQLQSWAVEHSFNPYDEGIMPSH